MGMVEKACLCDDVMNFAYSAYFASYHFSGPPVSGGRSSCGY